MVMEGDERMRKSEDARLLLTIHLMKIESESERVMSDGECKEVNGEWLLAAKDPGHDGRAGLKWVSTPADPIRAAAHFFLPHD